MSDVENIEDHFPCAAFEAMCLHCYKRWVAVIRTNELLKKLECPSCHQCGRVINTGQDMSA